MLFSLKKKDLGDGATLSYEEKFGLLTEGIKKFLETEDKAALAGTNDLPKTIYDYKHPVYNLFGSVYANLFVAQQREEIDKIIDNPIRDVLIKRVRGECLFFHALCGKKFVDTVTSNLISGIVAISGTTGKTSQALRRELETYFVKRPILWYCAVASTIFSMAVAENSKAARKVLAGSRSR